jgi:hypothetical protein
MFDGNVTRRRVVRGLAASSIALPLLERTAFAAAPVASKVTPELIEAARKEGKVIWYTAVDLPVAERIAKAFEAKYPGIAMRVERSGGERIYQRIGQEYASNYPRRRCGQQPRTPRISSSGSATASWRRMCPRTWRVHYPPSTGTSTACSPAGASGCA